MIIDSYTAVGIADGFIEPESEKQAIEAWQYLIDSGLWLQLQGRIGRQANDLIQAGVCTLPPKEQTDYYGNKVPAKVETVRKIDKT